jgi:hypothetical protein
MMGTGNVRQGIPCALGSCQAEVKPLEPGPQAHSFLVMIVVPERVDQHGAARL